MPLADRLQEIRKESGDSQEQLAEKLFVTRQAVSKWESGQGSPDISNIIKISEIYGVSTDYLLKDVPLAPPQMIVKKPMDPTLKKALSILLVIVGLAVVTVLFITALTFVGRYIIGS